MREGCKIKIDKITGIEMGKKDGRNGGVQMAGNEEKNGRENSIPGEVFNMSVQI